MDEAIVATITGPGGAASDAPGPEPRESTRKRAIAHGRRLPCPEETAALSGGGGPARIGVTFPSCARRRISGIPFRAPREEPGGRGTVPLSPGRAPPPGPRRAPHRGTPS